MTDITVSKAQKLNGTITIPSDKSISHRSAMFAALTKGKVEIRNFSKGADCRSTLNIVKQLGCEVEFLSEQDLIIDAQKAFENPCSGLDCGNSGTSMRLFSGLLAPMNGTFRLYGDESLSKRPMKRVISPLEQMGAKIEHSDYKAPLIIHGIKLNPIHFKSPLASAQVKSCVLLAGLNTRGETVFEEPFISRDHTERLLKYLGADIKINGCITRIKKSILTPKPVSICGDISSASFFLAAGAVVPNSDIILKNVGINPTRTGIIEVLQKMGAELEIINEQEISGEPVGDIRIKYSELKGITIEGAIIPRLIDEIPVIAVLATQADGTTIIKNAQDLRNKESDRITCLVNELKKLGAEIEETSDGMIIQGKTDLKGGVSLECYHDHRLAMSFYIAGLIAQDDIVIKEFQWVDISFPEFLSLIHKLKDN